MALYGTGAVLAYATKALLGRALGPTDYGVVSLMLSISLLAAGIGGLGLPVALTRFLAFHRERESSFRMVLVGLVAIALGSLAAGVVAFAVFSRLLPGMLGGLAAWEVTLLVALSVAAGLGDGAAGVGRGLGWVGRPLLLRDVVQRSIVLAGAAAVVLFSLGPIAAIVAYVCGAAVYAIGGLLVVLAHFLPRAPQNHWPGWKSDFGTLILFSWPLIGSLLCIQVVNQADNLFVAAFRGAYAVGLYNAAFPIAQIIWLGADTVVFVAGPTLARAAGSGSVGQLTRQYRYLLLIAIGVAALLAAPMVAMPTAAINLLFGPAYRDAGPALAILAVGACAYSAGGVSGSALVAQGRTIAYLASDAAGMVLNLLLHWTLVPRFGVMGAAVAVAAALTVVAVIRTASIGPALGKVADFNRNVALPAVLLVAGAGAASFVAVHAPLPPTAQLLIAYAVLGVVITPFLARTAYRMDRA